MYSKEIKLLFKYGNPDFAAVCKPGIFYVDRTNFIPSLEQSGEILTFLRPRRFGKTMIISMLDYYYNIKYKDSFEELFGHLEIGKNPTSERNSYLIFRISFSSLNTKNADSFEQSLNKTLNAAVRRFKDEYVHIFGDLIEKIIVDEQDGVISFLSLTDFISLGKFKRKLYILIDEYDNSLNKALSDTKVELYESLYVQSNEKESLKKNIQKEQQSSFRRFFSTIKDKFSEGGVGRVFITGVSPIALNDFTSGFNISKHITHHEEFEGICGVYDSEIKIALEKIVPKDKFLIEEVLKVMKDNYNGYMFTPTQSTPIFNTTLVIYFLEEFQRLKKIPKKLIDPNVQPSESGLDIISKTPLAQQLIDELYQNEERGIYIQEDVSDTIATRDMMRLLQTNTLYILSFLYYLGALTQTFLPKDKDIGTVFKIPNQVIKKMFIDNIKQRLLNNEKVQIELIQSVNTLIQKRDISPICELLERNLLSHLNGNDVVFSLENSVKTSFLLGFHLSGRKMKIINEYKENEDKNSRWADLVIVSERIHFEFKNLKMNNIILEDGRNYQEKMNWNIGIEYAKEIEKLNEEEMFKLKLKYPVQKEDKQNYLNRELKTIGDYWENVLFQTKVNNDWISKENGQKFDSFAILRVGLYQLKYKKIEY